MSVIHVNQIRTRIETLFASKVDLIDAPKSGSDRDSFFLTRGLAAYAICFLSGADADSGAAAVVDGGSDNGIDAIHFEPSKKILFLVQSKWIHDGKGEPANGDVKKFVAGIRDLFNMSFDRFNDKIRKKQTVIAQALGDPETTYQIAIAYTGISELATPSQRDLDDLESEMNDATEVLSILKLNQTALHKSLVSGIAGVPINLQVGLRSWGKLDEPYPAYYGQVNGAEIASWWADHGERLFARNLRSVLGDTEVNSEIRKTIESDPHNFWYFNNGITLTSKSVAKTMVGGADRDSGTFHCEDVSIVNGAQTAASIGKYAGLFSDGNVGKVYVPIRIISIDGSTEFADCITRSNNRQNRIENRDFVRQDPEQIRIRTELAIDQIDYNLMRAEVAISGPSSFDLLESTTALACASSKIHLVVQLKREIGKLWENLEKAPYKELFNPTVPGLFVWRCVQIQRLIDNCLSGTIKGLSGRDYGIAVHGNRMIAAMAFKKINPTQFHNPSFDFSTICKSSVIDPFIIKAFQKLKDDVATQFCTALIPTLFKNLSKCKALYE